MDLINEIRREKRLDRVFEDLELSARSEALQGNLNRGLQK